MNDSNYSLTAIGKLIERRAKNAKLFWFGCVPSRKRLNKSRASTASVCDGETQTTPTAEKTFCMNVSIKTEDCLQMPAESCVVDSSRHSLDSHSDTYMESCDSRVDEGVFDEIHNFGKCPCIEKVRDVQNCNGHLHEDVILEKLTNLQQEVNLIRYKLDSFKSDDEKACVLDDCESLQVALPFLPPPPPPFPSSPIFQHSVSLQSLTQKQSTSKNQSDEIFGTQDRGKPIITLEELQKVKLRQVSYSANVNF